MTERLDALMARTYERDGETKTAYSRIGVAFPTKNGGWSVKLEAMPAPVDGEYSILLFPPKPRDEAPARQPASGGYSADKTRRATPTAAPSFDKFEDDIPF